MTLTSEDMLKSIELQKNVLMRNDLQANVGTLSSFLESTPSDGDTKSLAQLRKETRHKWTIYPHKSKLHLDSEVTDAIIVTPTKPLDNNDNSRWYRNGLINTTAINNLVNDGVKTDSCEVKIIETKGDKLKKSVIKCLLDVTSPPNKSKKVCFKKMVSQDDTTKTIINMAVEMESLAEEIKNMLLNHYSD